MLRDTVASLVEKHASPGGRAPRRWNPSAATTSRCGRCCASRSAPRRSSSPRNSAARVANSPTPPSSSRSSASGLVPDAAARHHARRAGAAVRRRTRRRHPREAGRGRVDRRRRVRSRLRASTVTSPTSSRVPRTGELTRWTEFTADPVVAMDPTRGWPASKHGDRRARRRSRAGRHRGNPVGGRADWCRQPLPRPDRRLHQGTRPVRQADRQLPGAQAPDGRPLRQGAVRARGGRRRRRRPVADVGRAGPGRGQRGVHRRRRRGHPDARRHRDHLGVRHPAVLQAGPRQRAAARTAAGATCVGSSPRCSSSRRVGAADGILEHMFE